MANLYRILAVLALLPAFSLVVVGVLSDQPLQSAEWGLYGALVGAFSLTLVTGPAVFASSPPRTPVGQTHIVPGIVALTIFVMGMIAFILEFFSLALLGFAITVAISATIVIVDAVGDRRERDAATPR